MMIKITRTTEPVELGKIRSRHLLELRLIHPAPKSEQIPDSYKSVGSELWACQHNKCCYCEIVIQKKFNDVEHYRPKGSATRSPGCVQTHGYWWLAYTWENLMFSCPNCNRSAKNDLFPLSDGSSALMSEVQPPGLEVPLLIDPSGIMNPVAHIEFRHESLRHAGPKYWYARSRGDSVYGEATIQVCDLNRLELLEIRDVHYRMVIVPQVQALQREIDLNRKPEILIQFTRAKAMIEPENQFAAFTYDVFRAMFADKTMIAAIGKTWPEPCSVCA